MLCINYSLIQFRMSLLSNLCEDFMPSIWATTKNWSGVVIGYIYPAHKLWPQHIKTILEIEIMWNFIIETNSYFSGLYAVFITVAHTLFHVNTEKNVLLVLQIFANWWCTTARVSLSHQLFVHHHKQLFQLY